MPSVILTWRGQLRSPEKQRSLCSHLCRIGMVSTNAFDEAPAVRRFDTEIEGSILIDSFFAFFGDSSVLQEVIREVEHAGGEVLQIPGWPSE